jgi:esterase
MTVNLAFDTLGSGPPLVIMHGLLGSARNWGSLSKRFAQEGFRVILPDLRNHGRSPHHPITSYPAMAGDVVALLDSLGVERAAILGHSMGGKVAMTMALTQPERVERLLALDVAPVAYQGHGFSHYIAAMRSAPVAQTERRADIDAFLQAVAPEPAIRAFLLSNLAREGERFVWQPNLPALQDAMDAIVGWPPSLAGTRYDGPTLFLAGGASGYVRTEHHGLIRALFPQATIDHIADAGHWVHAENPGAFLRQSLGFLRP